MYEIEFQHFQTFPCYTLYSSSFYVEIQLSTNMQPLLNNFPANWRTTNNQEIEEIINLNSGNSWTIIAQRREIEQQLQVATPLGTHFSALHHCASSDVVVVIVVVGGPDCKQY